MAGKDLGARVRAVLARNAPLTRAPGISVAIKRAGEPVVTAQHGEAVVGDAAPVRADTLFPIASITKTLVAALFLRLQEEGTLSLDDPLSRWLPDHTEDRRVTLRRLLGHTSGIPDLAEWPEAAARDPDRVWTTDAVLALATGPRRPPGGTGLYSSTNYVLLGSVVRRATGQTVAEALDRLVLTPLRLADRVVLQPDEPAPADVAHGYVGIPGQAGLRDVSRPGRYAPDTATATIVGAAGAALASPATLAEVADALFGGRVLSAASLKQMLAFHPVAGPDGRTDPYGLGIGRVRTPVGSAYTHFGGMPGFESALVHLPAERLSIALTWNGSNSEDVGFSESVLTELLAEVLGKKAA